jgi:hypothetical protein
VYQVAEYHWKEKLRTAYFLQTLKTKHFGERRECMVRKFLGKGGKVLPVLGAALLLAALFATAQDRLPEQKAQKGFDLQVVR